MTKYIECIKCKIEQPVTSYITMASGEIKELVSHVKMDTKVILNLEKKMITLMRIINVLFVKEHYKKYLGQVKFA